MSDINYINQIAQRFHSIDFEQLNKNKNKTENKFAQKGTGQKGAGQIGPFAMVPYRANSFSESLELMSPKRRPSYSLEEHFDFSSKIQQLAQNPPTHIKPPPFPSLQHYISRPVRRSQSLSLSTLSPSIYPKKETLVNDADVEFDQYRRKALLTAGHSIPDYMSVSEYIKQESEKKGKGFQIKSKILAITLFFAAVAVIYFFIMYNPIPNIDNVIGTMSDGSKGLSLTNVNKLLFINAPIWIILGRILPPILIKFGIKTKNAVTPYILKALYFLMYKVLLFIPMKVINYLGKKDTLFRKIVYYPAWTTVKITTLITQTLKGLTTGITASISFIIQIFDSFSKFLMLLL